MRINNLESRLTAPFNETVVKAPEMDYLMKDIINIRGNNYCPNFKKRITRTVSQLGLEEVPKDSYLARLLIAAKLENEHIIDPKEYQKRQVQIQYRGDTLFVIDRAIETYLNREPIKETIPSKIKQFIKKYNPIRVI